MKIRRGCTDDLDINYFMVDHVCMTEGGGRGKMCFCERNECNSAVALLTSTRGGKLLSARHMQAILLLSALLLWRYSTKHLAFEP